MNSTGSIKVAEAYVATTKVLRSEHTIEDLGVGFMIFVRHVCLRATSPSTAANEIRELLKEL